MNRKCSSKDSSLWASRADLVPVFSFGENDLYKQFGNPPGSRVRSLQEKLKKITGITLPLINGRGIFQYYFGLLPFRKKLICVGMLIVGILQLKSWNYS